MEKKFRLSAVAAIILSLILPASPASTSGGGLFFASSAGELQVQVVDSQGVLREGGVSIERKISDFQYEFLDEQYAEEGQPTSFTFTGLANETYRVVAQAYDMGSFAMNSYFEVDFDSSGNIVANSFHLEGQPNATVALVNGVYNLPVYVGNFYLPVNLPDGTPFIPQCDEFGCQGYLNAELEREDGVDNWVQVGWQEMYQIRDDNWDVVEAGIVGRAVIAGNYRVRIVPDQIDGAAPAYSPEFTITSGELNADPKELAAVNLGVPALRIFVVDPVSQNPIGQSSVRVFKSDDSTIDFSSQFASTAISVVFDETGTFEIELSTNNANFADLARKRYSVVVTESDGIYSATVTNESDLDGIYYLELASANLVVSAIDPRAGNATLTHASANIFENRNGQSGDYVAGNWSQSGSLMSFTLDDGNYILELRPEIGDYLIATNKYFVNVTENGTAVAVTTFADSPSPVSDVDGVHYLEAALSNILGTLVDQGDALVVTNWQLRKWVNIDLLRYNGQWWDWVASSNADEYGRFSFSVLQGGSYKIDVKPQGYPEVGNLTLQFSVPDDLALQTLKSSDQGDVPDVDRRVKLPLPDLKVNVRVPNGTENLRNVQIDIFQGYDYIANVNTGDSRTAAITFPAGEGDYQLRIFPPRSAVGSARAVYDVEVTEVDGVRTVAITGAESEAGRSILYLGVPTLSGIVTDPSGDQLMRDVEVVPVDRETGWDLWEYSARTDAFGRWSIALPEGEFDVFARAPWGDATFGDGDRIGPVDVNANGVATSIPGGYSASAFDLKLNVPTWSGIMVSPTDSSRVLTNGQVCLATGGYESRTWSCAQTNSLGEWALSRPSGFTGFTDIDELIINEWGTREFAELRVQGETAIEAILGDWVTGAIYSNLEVSPAAPNLEVFVSAGTEDGEPIPAQNVWVGVDDGMQWLGGGATNSEGIAYIFIPEESLFGELNIQANIEHNQELSEAFASVRQSEGAVAEQSQSTPRTVDIALGEPNMKVLVTEPGGSNVVPFSWIEVINDDTGEWMGGSNTNQSGMVSLSLASSTTYRITVNPAWNATSDFTRRSYTVAVNADGSIDSVIDPQNQSITADVDRYTLALATPSVRGVVRSGDDQSTVRDAWVTPIADNGWEYMWWLGGNTRANGLFSLPLEDGTFLLEANPSWSNLAGDTKSKRCAVEVVGGQVNASTLVSDPCPVSNGEVILNLQRPNLTFTLVDGDDDPVPFGNVGMFLGNWNVWAQANRQGVVSMNLDGEEIKSRSGLTSGGPYNIRIVVEPQNGSSDLARFECDSGDQQQLCIRIPDFSPASAATYASGLTSNFTVELPEPNTKIQVGRMFPGDNNTSALGPLRERGSWVVVFEELDNGNLRWITGANTDGQGLAAFNLTESAGTTYTVEVNPPSQLRGELAQRRYSGLTLSQLQSETFGLADPNFSVKVTKSDSSGSASWSWVNVERWNAADSRFDPWASGSSADRSGALALSLQGGFDYRVTFNPADPTQGSRTSCEFRVAEDGTSSRLGTSCASRASLNSGVWNVTLSAGNVTGKAFYNDGVADQNLSGVLVQATATGKEAQSTVTNSNGSYALQLEEGVTWTIKFYFVPRDGVPAFANNAVAATSPVVASSTATDGVNGQFVLVP